MGRCARLISLLVLASCRFEHGAISNGSPDATSDVSDGAHDATIESAIWSFDTAADFARTGSQRGATGIEPWGSLTSAAYVPGGVIVRGVRQKIWDAAMTDAQVSWTAIETLTPDGIGFWRLTDISDPVPVRQFGIISYNQPFALWIEGELLLDAPGAHQFNIDGDDVAFLEIADQGTYQRIVTSRWLDTNGSVGTYQAASAGWVPFRIGLGQDTGSIRLGIQVLRPGASARSGIYRTHLRARAESLRGMQRTAFDQQMLTDAREVIGLETTDFITTNFSPLPIGVTTASNWSARWTGQFYVQVPGSYTFRTVSDDGNHVVIPGGGASAAWGYNLADASSQSDSAATLAAGWNQLVVDYNQVTGGQNAQVRLIAAPEPALVGVAIPATRLRPVETQLARAIPNGQLGVNATIVNNNNGNRASADFTVRGVTGEVTGVVDVVVRATSPDWTGVNVEVIRPDGQALTLCARNCATGSGDQTIGFETTSATIVGGPTAGLWRVRVWDDTGSGGNGTLTDAYLTVRCSGGMPTIASDASWTSEIVDLGASTLLDIRSVAWTARTPRDPADVEIRLRACDDASCSTEPWSAAVANGAAPTLPGGRRYVQAEARLFSDGLRETELEQLTISYRTAR